jgi:hypothetical protein
MSSLSTGKTYKDQVQIKGVLNNKTIGDLHTDLCGPTRKKGLNGEQ